MKKHIKYKTKGVCSRKIEFDIIDGVVHNKENWFSEYTDNEKKIIQNLFGSTLNQQVK